MSCVLTGHWSNFLNHGKSLSLKIVFILANSADSDKMPIPFRLEPQFLPKYLFTGIKNEKGHLEESYVDSNILLGIFISSIKFL